MSHSDPITPEARKKLMDMERSYTRLIQVQRSLTALNVEEEKRKRKLQEEFDTKRKPLWEERAKFIRKVDHFWTHTLANHDVISYCMMEQDVDVMNAILDLEIVDIGSAKKEKKYHGFRIVLHMKENEFIDDKVLWKEVRIKGSEDDGEEEEPEYTFLQSGMKWKPGKRYIPERKEDKVVKNKKEEEEKMKDEDEEEEERSFFEMFERETDSDTDICVLIKHEVWPNPIKFYAQEADDDDDDNENLDMDGDDE